MSNICPTPLDPSKPAHDWDDDGACLECGLTSDDEESPCPNCDSIQKSNDINALGDDQYECPNCKDTLPPFAMCIDPNSCRLRDPEDCRGMCQVYGARKEEQL